MFPRVETGPTDTVPEPANSGRIFGAPLSGPPYMPGGCETPLTFKEAITSGGPVKSSLIIEPLMRIRATVSAMQSLACKVSTPLPTLTSEPVPEITPEKEVLIFLVPTVRVLAPKKTFPEPLDRADGQTRLVAANVQVAIVKNSTRAVPPIEAP